MIPDLLLEALACRTPVRILTKDGRELTGVPVAHRTSARWFALVPDDVVSDLLTPADFHHVYEIEHIDHLMPAAAVA